MSWKRSLECNCQFISWTMLMRFMYSPCENIYSADYYDWSTYNWLLISHFFLSRMKKKRLWATFSNALFSLMSNNSRNIKHCLNLHWQIHLDWVKLVATLVTFNLTLICWPFDCYDYSNLVVSKTVFILALIGLCCTVP